jgi:AraC-like DNA-binding protein
LPFQNEMIKAVVLDKSNNFSLTLKNEEVYKQYTLGNLIVVDNSFVEIEIKACGKYQKFILTKNHWIPFKPEDIEEIRISKNHDEIKCFSFFFSKQALELSSNRFDYNIEELSKAYSLLVRYPTTNWMFELWNRLFFEIYMCRQPLESVVEFCAVEILKEKYYLTAGMNENIRLILGNDVNTDKDTDAAVKYILGNLDAEVTLEDIASQISVSISTLRRKFKKHFGIAPMNFLIKKRMAKAYELLTTTNYTVGDVAFFVGYSDHSAFTTAFKSEFKVTPSEIRTESARLNKKR